MTDSMSVREQTPDQRLRFYEVVQSLLLDGRLTMGQALRILRAQHLGLTRRQYAARVGLSNKALSHLENDAGNPTLASLEAAFRPFGFRVGIVPVAGSAVRVHPPDIDLARHDALIEAILGAVDRRA